MILRLLSFVNSARVFSRVCSRSVSYGEPFDPERVGTPYELTPTAESAAPGGSRFRLSTKNSPFPPLHESTLPPAGPTAAARPWVKSLRPKSQNLRQALPVS
jgi:hypothetical protein